MDIYETVISQYRVNKGLRLYKEDGFTALMKELKQLHTIKNVNPLNMEDITREQKHSAPQYLVFLTNKRSVRNKERGCSDGHKKHVPLKCPWRLL